jgi:hypothetical protein
MFLLHISKNVQFHLQGYLLLAVEAARPRNSNTEGGIYWKKLQIKGRRIENLPKKWHYVVEMVSDKLQRN